MQYFPILSDFINICIVLLKMLFKTRLGHSFEKWLFLGNKHVQNLNIWTFLSHYYCRLLTFYLSCIQNHLSERYYLMKQVNCSCPDNIFIWNFHEKKQICVFIKNLLCLFYHLKCQWMYFTSWRCGLVFVKYTNCASIHCTFSTSESHIIAPTLGNGHIYQNT